MSSSKKSFILLVYYDLSKISVPSPLSADYLELEAKTFKDIILASMQISPNKISWVQPMISYKSDSIGNDAGLMK